MFGGSTAGHATHMDVDDSKSSGTNNTATTGKTDSAAHCLLKDVIDAGQSNAKIAAAMAAYHTSTVCHRGSVVLHVHEEFRNLQQQALEIGRSVEGLLAQQPNTIQASSTLPPLDRACTNIDVEMEPVLKGGGQSNLHMTVNLQDLVMDSLHSAMITSVAELYTEAQSQVEEIKRIILGEVSQHSLHLSELGQDSDSMLQASQHLSSTITSSIARLNGLCEQFKERCTALRAHRQIATRSDTELSLQLGDHIRRMVKENLQPIQRELADLQANRSQKGPVITNVMNILRQIQPGSMAQC